MTTAAYLGWLAATGQRKVASVVSPVCVLDPTKTMDTTMGLLASERSLKAIKAAVKRKGVVEGAEMARVFAWLRPNDLIWNYWVNNYLMGNDPPAFDILFWNSDTTRLPAGFHADLISVFQDKPVWECRQARDTGPAYRHASGARGRLHRCRHHGPHHALEGMLRHCPHLRCQEPVHSGQRRAPAKHPQPPGIAKSFFYAAKVGGPDPDAWASTAARNEGSWWPHWMAWTHQRSGGLIPAPKKLGSRKHPPGVAAPGEYVMMA